MDTAYSQKALTTLKQQNYKLTRPRKLVVQLLAEVDTPLSAYEIRDRLLLLDEKIDVVSVYRILACLEQAQLIHRVPSSNKVFRCPINSHEHDCCATIHNHPVFVCDSCGVPQEILWHGTQSLIEAIQQKGDFRVDRIQLELRGCCANCLTQQTSTEVHKPTHYIEKSQRLE